MADRNQSETHHFGQPVRPPIPNQGVTNQAAGHGTGFQGAPKMAGMPPPPVQGQGFQGSRPHGFMGMNPSVGQAPLPQRFQGGLMGPPPPVGGSVNGFVPPTSQGLMQQRPAGVGLMQQRPAGVNLPWGPPGSGGGVPSQPGGGFHPPVSGQFVPASSSYSSAPVVNGTMNTAPLGFQQPVSQSPSQFDFRPVSQGDPNMGAPQQPMPLSQSSSSSVSTVTGFAGMSSAPPLPSGSIGSQSPSVSNASGTSTPSSGFPSRPNELPVPYHGQAQYSHQIGAAMMLTPTPTPNSSEPPSQKSSRGPSPAIEPSYDALEGQFSFPSAPGGEQTPTGMTMPPPSVPSSQGPFPPAVPGQQRIPFPPRPARPTNSAPPPRPGGAPMAPFGQQQQRAHPPVSQYPGSVGPPHPSGFLGQTGPPAPPQPRGMPPGPPRPPFSQPGPSTGGLQLGMPGPPPSIMAGSPTGVPRPPATMARPPFGLAGPPSSLPGPPMVPPSNLSGQPAWPLSSLAGPPSSAGGPLYNTGPPSSLAGGPPLSSGGPFYNTVPPSSLGGAPSGQVRPLQGPPPPTGFFNVGPPTSGHGPAPAPGSGSNYPQPPTLQSMVRPPGPMGGHPSGPPVHPSEPYGGGQSQQGYSLSQPAGLGQNAVNNMTGDFSRMGVHEMQRVINLMQEKELIAPEGVETAEPAHFQGAKHANCCPDVFRCTLNAIPQSSALLSKSRLPLGILIHPFKDLSQLPVIQSTVIVRCRSCRTYINPFVTFVDQRRWKCNLCFRVNELPDEFSFDPVTKTYGDPQRRPEIRSATIEFIAPSEYMLRPPQPAVYLFVLDVSFNAVETGYLRLFSQTLAEELERLPGDARTQVGFLCFDRALYFFNLSEGLSQPQMMVVPDLDEVFLPTPDNLLVNLHECRDMVMELLTQLPGLFEGNHETGNALGFALQAAFKLMSNTGGRVTVMQTTLPTVGPGALENREATSKASSLNSSNLGPASDFYKKLALDCSAQQVAVDVFMLNGQYSDIASVSCISKYSAGCVHYYPSFHTARNPAMSDKFESDLRRYLTRKIGFESVMRIRCTRGVSIHTFHGNFFVRSTDLLSLPNVNPDAGFGMQMSIEDNLTESSNVCFQAALLYTSSKGERRIRVHTLCVPTTNQLSEVFAGADQLAISALLAKMAADRTLSSSLEDAREALMNACQDMLNAYAAQVPASQRAGALLAPATLRLFPLITLAMLKSIAFRLSPNIKIDDRVFSHLVAKTTPLSCLLQTYYPYLYPVHALNDEEVTENSEEEKIPYAPQLQLNSANLDRHGVYIMDQGENIYMLVGGAVPDSFCKEALDVPNFKSIPEGMVDLPELDNPTSERLRRFINHLMDSRPGGISFLVIRDDSKRRVRFFQYMVEDRTESSMSYYEFLQFLQQKVKG